MTITATPLPPGQWQFCDEDGVPYDSGTLTHYYPGGSTPKDTYQNAQAGVLNDNPLTLDSAGRATIFGIGEYRQILKDADGNTIWDKPTVGFVAAEAAAVTITRSLTFIIDGGGGAAITTGVKGSLYIPFACTITGVELLGDQSGSIVVGLWNSAYSAYPPTISNSITGASPPTISSALKSKDVTLTGWTTSLAADSVLRYNVNSVTSFTTVTVALTVTTTN